MIECKNAVRENELTISYAVNWFKFTFCSPMMLLWQLTQKKSGLTQDFEREYKEKKLKVNDARRKDMQYADSGRISGMSLSLDCESLEDVE